MNLDQHLLLRLIRDLFPRADAYPIKDPGVVEAALRFEQLPLAERTACRDELPIDRRPKYPPTLTAATTSTAAKAARAGGHLPGRWVGSGTRLPFASPMLALPSSRTLLPHRARGGRLCQAMAQVTVTLTNVWTETGLGAMHPL